MQWWVEISRNNHDVILSDLTDEEFRSLVKLLTGELADGTRFCEAICWGIYENNDERTLTGGWLG